MWHGKLPLREGMYRRCTRQITWCHTHDMMGVDMLGVTVLAAAFGWQDEGVLMVWPVGLLCCAGPGMDGSATWHGRAGWNDTPWAFRLA